MRSEFLVAAVFLACSGCARVQRGTRPICYRQLGEVPTREAAPSESMSLSLVERQEDKPKSAAVIYKRIPTEEEVKRISREQEKPVVESIRPTSSETDWEKARLRRLLEMNLISREEYTRRMGEVR